MLLLGVLLLGALLLTAAAWLRGAEYDEQYTLLLTAGDPRPNWPDTVFPAGQIAAAQSGHATMAEIASDLRATDVHPPLYFWAVGLWRGIFGPSLFAARTLSVVCGVISLGLVGMIARCCSIAPVAPILITLGSYGFVYTNAIARGFAPAQMLTLCGLVLLLRRRPLLAGLSLGAACCCNYLAVFVAAGLIVAAGAFSAVLAAVPFLALDGWFFVAQHASRQGQFPPFALWPSVVRLTQYQMAAVFGGLPLYFTGVGRLAVAGVLGLLAVAMALAVARGRPLSAGAPIRMLLAASVAPPIGLLLLGAVFDNTPIELRYLSFGLPFIALMVAWASAAIPQNRTKWCGWNRCTRRVFSVASLSARFIVKGDELRRQDTSTRPRRRTSSRRLAVLPLVVVIQFAGISGLLFSQRTMQPARATAAEADRLARDAVVLLPRGNDGVGIVGAFGIEAPADLKLLLISPDDPIDDRIAPYRRVALAVLAQDRDSIASIAALHRALGLPNWRLVANGFNLEVYQRAD